jgi:hypothetical protein
MEQVQIFFFFSFLNIVSGYYEHIDTIISNGHLCHINKVAWICITIGQELINKNILLYINDGSLDALFCF